MNLASPKGSKLANIFDGLTKSLNIKITAPVGPLLLEAGCDISERPKNTEIPLKVFNRATRELFKKDCALYQFYFFVDELVFSRLNATEDEITLRAAMVRDILRTAWELNSFCSVNALDFHFICSVRPEVKNMINEYDAESGKFLDGKDVELSWLSENEQDGKLIMEVFRAKVAHSHHRKVDFDIFVSNEISFNGKPGTIEDFIVRNTWCRPRDVVRLLNSIAKKSPNKEKIGEEEIKAAINDYSRASAKEVIDELGVRYGRVVLDALRNGISRQVYSDRDEFWESIRKHLKGESAVGLLDELFYLGVIGGYDPSKGRHYWAYRGNSYLQPNHKIRIHPALWSEFQIQ